jgi:hypothetical protein
MNNRIACSSHIAGELPQCHFDLASRSSSLFAGFFDLLCSPEPPQALMANPAKIAEWLALAPPAAGSAVMFHFGCCNVLQDISLLRGNQYIHCRRAMNTAFVVHG